MFKPMIHMCIARSILVTSTACLPSPPAKPTRSITPLLPRKSITALRCFPPQGSAFASLQPDLHELHGFTAVPTLAVVETQSTGGMPFFDFTEAKWRKTTCLPRMP